MPTNIAGQILILETVLDESQILNFVDAPLQIYV
jgi:hypothetical protein